MRASPPIEMKKRSERNETRLPFPDHSTKDEACNSTVSFHTPKNTGSLKRFNDNDRKLESEK